MTMLGLWLAVVGVADLARWRSDAGLRRQLLAGGLAELLVVAAVLLGDVSAPGAAVAVLCSAL